MRSRPRFSLRLWCGLLALATGSVLAAPASAQVLPLVAERGDGGASAFWWSEASVRLTPLDRALLEALATAGVDPSRVAGAPAVSQVYRVPGLSAGSARNLGGLFGAASVLVGTAEARVLGPLAGELLWVAEIDLDARWLAVGAELERAQVRRSALGEGLDAEAALADARRELAAEVAHALSQRQAVAPGVADPRVDGPVLLVRNPPSAAHLVALLSELRERHTVIADLREAWAAQGVLAYAVELAPGAPASAFDDVIDELATDPSWGYALWRVRGDGLATEVRLEALPPPTLTPELTPPP